MDHFDTRRRTTGAVSTLSSATYHSYSHIRSHATFRLPACLSACLQVLRGIGCNWLVCLGFWSSLAAEDIIGECA